MKCISIDPNIKLSDCQLPKQNVERIRIQDLSIEAGINVDPLYADTYMGRKKNNLIFKNCIGGTITILLNSVPEAKKIGKFFKVGSKYKLNYVEK